MREAQNALLSPLTVSETVSKVTVSEAVNLNHGYLVGGQSNWIDLHEIPEVSEWQDIPGSCPGVIMETPSLNCNSRSEIREVHCTRKDTEVE